MSYLQHEWKSYQYHDWRLFLVALAIIEDGARWLQLPWGTLRPIWLLRGRLTEGKSRRLLRRFVRHWAKTGDFSQSYFYDCEHGREDRLGQVVVVTVEWKEFSQ
jgi:hypothetical protein